MTKKRPFRQKSLSSTGGRKESASPRLRERLRNRLPQDLVKKVFMDRFGSINFILPNLTTIMALCMGLSAVRFALNDKWDIALGAVLVAGILDGMDGRLARMLNSTSRFGAELDSLSDFVSFGISPAMIIYFKSLQTWQGYGWIFVLYYSVCMALRLARFNTMSIEGDNSPSWSSNFFIGVPAPASALVALMPAMISIELPDLQSPGIYAFFLFFSGSLAISRIPTFSFKKIKIPPSFLLPFMIGGVLLLGLLFAEPWLTLSFLAIGYLFLIPFSVKAHRQYGQEKNPLSPQ